MDQKSQLSIFRLNGGPRCILQFSYESSIGCMEWLKSYVPLKLRRMRSSPTVSVWCYSNTVENSAGHCSTTKTIPAVCNELSLPLNDCFE